MDSAKDIQTELRRFLSSAEPEVICLSGEWGVGKTFLWNRLLSEAKAEKSLKLERYSYVSLFGVNNLDGLKQAVFENVEFVSDRAPNDIKSQTSKFWQWTKKHTGWSLSDLGKAPVLGEWVAAVGPLFFATIRTQFVCIDDLERRGENLRTTDVLGLVNFLREQRGCKVAILLNRNGLDAEAKTDFESNLEKVVDVELNFVPAAAECAEIALSMADTVSELIAKNCIKLGVSNIRVIKKVERLVRQVSAQLEQFDGRILEQGVHTLSLLVWCKYQPKSAPSLEWIKGERNNRYYGIGPKKEDTDEERRWKRVLTDYDFRLLDNLDMELLSGVENGYFDILKINTEASQRQLEITAVQKEDTFNLAWREFHDSFDDNQDEVVRKFVKSTKENSNSISPNNLNNTIKVLKELGHEKEAAETLDAFIATNAAEAKFWDLRDADFYGQEPLPELINAFQKKYTDMRKVLSPVDVLNKISDRGWNDDDISDLSKTTPEEFYKIFKAARDENLKKLVLAALRFDQVVDASEQMKSITSNARNALSRIGKESKINELRLQKYGIKLDLTEH